MSNSTSVNSPYIIEIAGREAILVRALPFISNGEIPPDLIPKWLANQDTFYRLPLIQAFHIMDDQPVPIPALYWERIINRLDALQIELHATEPEDGANYPAWEVRSTEILPCVFIWRDDFERAWSAIFGGEPGNPNAILSANPRDDSCRKPNYYPFIDAPINAVVLEGAPKLKEVQKQDAQPKTKECKEWIALARELADQHIQAWAAEGHVATKADAALYVEGVFSTKGIYGERGELLDRATIERHALNGITGRKPGQRSKTRRIPEGERGSLPKFK